MILVVLLSIGTFVCSFIFKVYIPFHVGNINLNVDITTEVKNTIILVGADSTCNEMQK